MDQARVNGWLVNVKKYTVPVLYAFALPGSYIGRIIQVLIYAAIGLMFAHWCKCERSYAQLLRLAVVAMTPCIIIKTALSVIDIGLPVFGLWYILIALGYLLFGIKASSTGEELTQVEAGNGHEISEDPE